MKKQELQYEGTVAPALSFINIKEKIPSSQAKDGLTYDGISREIDNSSAFSIIYMLAEVKIIIWMKIQLGLEQIMIDIILKYVLCCSLKSVEMVNFKGRIKIFNDEIFTGKAFSKEKKSCLV